MRKAAGRDLELAASGQQFRQDPPSFLPRLT
jgi:hypothetical protein